MQTLFLMGILGLTGFQQPSKAIEAVLDDWHQAAAVTDEKRYFDHIADAGVFMGTDATERWTKQAFREFAHPYFAKGKAWNFKATKRFVTPAADGKTAWFDELLDTEKMGVCRGSGVMIVEGGRWRVVQYNLSTPIPNPVMSRVLELIQAHEKRATKP